MAFCWSPTRRRLPRSTLFPYTTLFRSFAVVSTTQKLEYDLYAESSYLLHITDFPSQYEFLAVLPRIEIQKILGYYYRIRTENYCFKGELHDFFELTYVDTGELETEVDGTLYH